MDLTEATAQLITAAIRTALAGMPATELVGISCLAPGADTIFALEVLALGGRLEAVIPAADYRDLQERSGDAAVFDELVARAIRTIQMPFVRSSPEAYAAANERLLASCDRLIAIWDGNPAADAGGTAAVAREAQRRGIPVDVIWPAGARRR
jgi:hypothetical protein